MKFTTLASLGLVMVLSASSLAAPPAGIFDKKKPAAPAPAPAAQPRPAPAPVAQPRPQPAPQPAPVARPQQQPQPQSAPVPSVPSQFIRPQPKPQAQPQAQPQPQAAPAAQPQNQFLPKQAQGGLRAQPQTQPRPQQQPQPQHDDHDHDNRNALRGTPSSKQVIVNGIIRSLVTPQRNYDHDHDHDHFGSFRGGRGGYYGPGYLPAPYYVGPQYVQPIIIQPQYVDPGVRIVRPDAAPPESERLVVQTLDQFSEIPDPSQRDFLLHALNNLETDLNRMTTGDSWKKHLQLSTIASLLDEKDNGPDAVRRDRLGQIATDFDAIDRDSKYRQVSDLWGFDTLRIGLRAYSAPAEVRLRKQIGGATDALAYALNNVDTGEGWKKHLQLEFLTSMSPATDANRAERIQQIGDLVVRFDGVATDDSFRVISSKPGFAEARDMLKQYVQALRGDAKPDAPKDDIEPPKDDVAPPQKKSVIDLPKAESSEPPKPEDK